jgi:S1-C subfamily serine protease
MKKLFLVLMFVIMYITVSCAHIQKHSMLQSDKYIRDRVLMITGKNVLCSAIEVRAPSGKNYTMSAAHCAAMAINGYVTAINEDGDQKMIKVLEVDDPHDLMLLEPYDEKSIDVAKSEQRHQRVHTITHGHGMPSYRTDGELLDIVNITLATPIDSDEALAKCKNIVINDLELGCEKKYNVIMSTAQVLPGSSGGAVLNEEGKLVGIVSCTDGFFAGFIPIDDINNLLKGR